MIKKLCALAIFVSSQAAFAAPVIEIYDRLEVNWTTLRIRFYGHAASSDSYGAYKNAEKKAWQDGLAYLQEAIRQLNNHNQIDHATSDNMAPNQLKNLINLAVKSTSSYSTTYFADGSVKVILENQLPKMFETIGIRFRQKEPSAFTSLQYTGIGIRLSRAIRPSAQFKVLDENGGLLFEVQDMAEEAYRRNLMGRWLKRPATAEIQEIIGNNPAMIDAKALADGKIQVEKEAWDSLLEGHRTLLVNGIIALIQP